MLSARDLEHGYDGRRVLDIDAFRVPAGAVTALVGANGSGKSTLLRVLALLETPGRGVVSLHGAPLLTRAARRAARRRVTLVEQHPLLFDGTVSDNLHYALALHGVRGDTGRVREALDLLDLSHLAGRDARGLSAGETQRVALARAAALAPDVLLLDEPLSAGDRSAAHLLGGLLERERSRGTAICLSSHRLEEAYRWSAAIVSLHDGRTDPVTPENLFRTEIPPGDGPRTVRCGPLEMVVVTDRAGPATLAVPPDDIVVSPAPLTASTRNQYTGRITRIEDDGHGHIALTADFGVELTARITPDALTELALGVGAPVVFAIKAMSVRVF